MGNNVAWIDSFGVETRPYRDELELAFPHLHFRVYEQAGEAYMGFQREGSDIVVMNPWLAPGLDCPYPYPSEGLNNPARIGFDLATRIRALDPHVPIILFGWASEIRVYDGEKSSPCPEASEIVNATRVLPHQFREIMRKYIE